MRVRGGGEDKGSESREFHGPELRAPDMVLAGRRGPASNQLHERRRIRRRTGNEISLFNEMYTVYMCPSEIVRIPT